MIKIFLLHRNKIYKMFRNQYGIGIEIDKTTQLLDIYPKELKAGT